MKKAFYITGIVAFIVMMCLSVAHFCVILRYSPCINVSKPTGHTEAIPNPATDQDSNNPANSTVGNANVKGIQESSRLQPGAEVSPEYYLGEITNFYGNVMVILFSTIAILLAISFIYVYTVSRGKAEDLARQSLNEEAFQIVLSSKIDKALAELKNEGDIAEWFEKVEDFEERIDFLEKAITRESYETKQLSREDKLEGGEPNGSNKAV